MAWRIPRPEQPIRTFDDLLYNLGGHERKDDATAFPHDGRHPGCYIAPERSEAIVFCGVDVEADHLEPMCQKSLRKRLSDQPKSDKPDKLTHNFLRITSFAIAGPPDRRPPNPYDFQPQRRSRKRRISCAPFGFSTSA
jgi:hypothetical protein